MILGGCFGFVTGSGWNGAEDKPRACESKPTNPTLSAGKACLCRLTLTRLRVRCFTGRPVCDGGGVVTAITSTDSGESWRGASNAFGLTALTPAHSATSRPTAVHGAATSGASISISLLASRLLSGSSLTTFGGETAEAKT